MTRKPHLFKVGRWLARRDIDGDRIARRKGLLERRIQQALDLVCFHTPSLPARRQRSVTLPAAGMTSDILRRRDVNPSAYMALKRVLVVALAALVLATGLGWWQRAAIVVWLAPAKAPSTVQSETAKRANDKFWNA